MGIHRSKETDEDGVAEMFAYDYRYRVEAWAPQEQGMIVCMDIIGCAILRWFTCIGILDATREHGFRL